MVSGSDRVLNNPVKRAIVDLFVIFLGVTVCCLLVQSLSGLPKNPMVILTMAGVISIAHVGFLYLQRGYRSAWRFFSAHDGLSCAAAAFLATTIAAVFWYSAVPAAGWVVIGIGTAITAFIPRLLTRVAASYRLIDFATTPAEAQVSHKRVSQPQKRALMIGFGENLESFLRAQRKRSSDFEVAGIVDINGVDGATNLRGIPVLGTIDNLNEIVATMKNKDRAPDMLILTRDQLGGFSVAEILAKLDGVDANIAWLPRMDQLDLNGGDKLRPIELEDLLPRPAKSFDALACQALLEGSRVLVTGAGGSIGSELVRQITSLMPSEIILADASEHALYQIDREVSVSFPSVKRISSILDVRDRDAVMRLMRRERPEFVFHAAALKHVPIVEGQPCEGLLTNVVGSQNVADAASECNVRTMVMVSTDKAVNPANVMGATKRLAEAYCQAMDAEARDKPGATRFVTVRFGNVLGSSGSVVPLFQRQLEQGGPLTVTHPEVERFFMTIPEASRLILEAMLQGMGDGNAEQGIFVLDMGEPVKINDLARQVIRLSGLRPDVDVKIVYTGLRPGEKLYEELMHESENLLPTDHPSLMVACPRFVQLKTVRSQVSNITEAARKGDGDEVVRLLKVYIPEFDATSNEAKKAQSAPFVLHELRDQAS